MSVQLETLTRRLELKQVRHGKEKLPGVVGFRGQLLVDCNLAHGKVALHIVALKKFPVELELESGAPTEESITVDEPALHGKLRVYAANPARALRIIYRAAVRDTLVELLAANARLTFGETGLHIEAPAVDAEAALPIATRGLRLIEALEEAARDEVLRAETDRQAAKELPLPEGKPRRFVALREVELDERKLEKLQREARAMVYWRKSTAETREVLQRAGASDALADELIAEFTAERERQRHRDFAKKIVFAVGLVAIGVLLIASQQWNHDRHDVFASLFIMVLGMAAMGLGLRRLGAGIYEYVREALS